MITEKFQLTAITSKEDVRAFFEWLEEVAMCAFHPDDTFSNYVDEDGNQSFTNEDCALYDSLMGQCFETFQGETDDIYSFACETSKRYQALVKGGQYE
jgi:hypothetical protein